MIKGGLLQTQGRGRQSLDGREITAKEWVLALVISNKIGQGGKALGFGGSVSSKVATAMATIESAVAGQTLPPDMVLARHFYDKVSQPSMICRTRWGSISPSHTRFAAFRIRDLLPLYLADRKG